MKQNSYQRPGILRTTLYPNGFKRNVTSYHAMSILLKIKDRKVLGDQAPDFELPSTTGGKISLSQFRGKKLVLLEFYGADFAPV